MQFRPCSQMLLADKLSQRQEMNRVIMEKKKPNAIVLYPSPGRDHLNPIVKLSKLILRDHPSFSITIITSSLPPYSPDLRSYASKVSASADGASINFIHLEAPLASTDDVRASFGDPTLRDLAAREYVASFFEIPKLNNEALREALLSLSLRYHIRALVMDYFCHLASPIAASLNLPAYYFRTQGAFSANFYLYFSIIDKMITSSESLKDLPRDFLVEFPGVPPIPRRDIMVPFIDRSHRVYNYFVDGSVKLAKSNGVIVNTFESLELSTLKTIMEGKCTLGELNVPPVYCVGPLLTDTYSLNGAGVDQGNHCLTWLDSQPSGSVLFLCFGRTGILSSRQLKEIAIGLERSGVRFLWVVRNPPERASEENIELDTLLPQGFLERTKERGLVVKNWAPQFQALSHGSVGGFVTHCGWSSVMEAVCSGVPMLAWPLYAEQKMNRVYMCEGIKVALSVREDTNGWVSSDELEEKVIELMSSEKEKDMRHRATLMKQAALEALSDGGSSRIAIAKLVDNFKL